MELEESLLNLDKETTVGGDVQETVDIEFASRKELEDYRKRGVELEWMNRNNEERCMILELEVQKEKREFQSLDGRFRALENEKLAIEDELKVEKKRNEELEERISRIENGKKIVGEGEMGVGMIIDLSEEKDVEDKVYQLMVENKVLECEKKKAERDAEVWKVKFKESEARAIKLEECLRSRDEKLPVAGKEMNGTRGMTEGSDIATNSTPLHTDIKMVVSEEKIQDPSAVISTCYPPISGNMNLQASGEPSTVTPCVKSTLVEGGQRLIHSGTKLEYASQVRKRLIFEEAGSPYKKIAPSTPAGVQPVSTGVIDIDDSDDQQSSSLHSISTLKSPREETLSVSTDCDLECTVYKHELSSTNDLKRGLLEQSEEEDMGGYQGRSRINHVHKRKRAFHVVTSDSESDNDDNVPLSKFIFRDIPESNRDSTVKSCSLNATVSEDKVEKPVSKRRLVRLRKCEVDNGPEKRSPSPSRLKTSEACNLEILTNEDVEENEMEEDESESEGDSLGEFIVDSSNVSESAATPDESEDTSDDNMDYGEIISRIRRDRDQNSKWEFEAEMLAALNKDPELCMRAVCALFRQQTEDEKDCKGTIHRNGRGFNQCDAPRGTKLAEFLTDGYRLGDVVKSVEELQEHDPDGLEGCRKLANHYSKQLFDIYNNKEDPFFHP